MLHFQNGDIGIIDCFNNPSKKVPQPLLYIKEVLGVNCDNVKFILLTHLHSDHISGVSQLIQACQKCKIYMPASIRSEIARSVVQLSTLNRADITGINQTLDLFEFIKEHKLTVHSVKAGDIIYKNSQVNITALSPTQKTIDHFEKDYSDQFKEIEKRLNQGNVPYKVKLSESYNHHSIVLKVAYEKYNLLLTGDLEVHKDKDLGLGPVLESLSKHEMKFTLFKVPHHGSHNGVTTKPIEKVNALDFEKWIKVIDPDSVRLAMTSKGIVPQEKMVVEMLSLTDKCFITTNPNKRFVEPKEAIRKEINKTGLNINYVSKHYGLLRFWYSEEADEIMFEPRNYATHLSALLNN